MRLQWLTITFSSTPAVFFGRPNEMLMTWKCSPKLPWSNRDPGDASLIASSHGLEKAVQGAHLSSSRPRIYDCGRIMQITHRIDSNRALAGALSVRNDVYPQHALTSQCGALKCRI